MPLSCLQIYLASYMLHRYTEHQIQSHKPWVLGWAWHSALWPSQTLLAIYNLTFIYKRYLKWWFCHIKLIIKFIQAETANSSQAYSFLNVLVCWTCAGIQMMPLSICVSFRLLEKPCDMILWLWTHFYSLKWSHLYVDLLETHQIYVSLLVTHDVTNVFLHPLWIYIFNTSTRYLWLACMITMNHVDYPLICSCKMSLLTHFTAWLRKFIVVPHGE